MADLKRPISGRQILIAGGVAIVIGVSFLAIASFKSEGGFWGSENAAWWQAVGSVLAILAGFAVAGWQSLEGRDDDLRLQTEAATAACILGQRALERVADRLAVAYRPFSKAKVGLALRRHRTTELIKALREVELGKLPPIVLAQFATLRSDLYAINARISEIYDSEEKRGRSESERPTRLRSSLTTYSEARATFHELNRLAQKEYGVEILAIKEPPELGEMVGAAVLALERRLAAQLPTEDPETK